MMYSYGNVCHYHFDSVYLDRAVYLLLRMCFLACLSAADGTVLEEFDSLQLLSEIVFLVLEARSPAHSLKGRTEGLHCRIPRSHQCHMSHDEVSNVRLYVDLSTVMNGV